MNIFNFGRGLKHFVSGRIFAGSNLGLSDLLMYAKLIDDGVIIQSDGSFLCAFWYRGFDLETSTDEELSILSSQLNSAFNLIGSGWMFHIDTLRYLAKDYTSINECNFTEATTTFIDEERRNLYQQQGNHYENTYVISFTYRPKIDFGSKLGLFFKQKTNNKEEDYFQHLKYFKNKVSEVSGLLSQQLNLSAMNDYHLVSYLSWCITGEIVQLKLPLRHGTFLKHLLASKDLIGGDNPKIGDKHFRTITIMGFPNESYPGILDQLNYVDFEYRWNTRFILISQYEGSKIIDRISSLWYQKRISAMDTIKMSLAIDSNIKVNQNSETQYSDAEEAKAVNEGGELKFGFYTSTVIIMDEDESIVERNAAVIRNLFRGLGFQSQVERHHTIEAYLGSLPGYSYANVRKWLIHSLNVADILPSTSIWSGLTHNPCSFYKDNNPPLFYATTTGNSPIRLSLHVNDNGHTLILGPTGSGKSTLLNFLVSQHFRYRNARVFVFDKNRSSLPLCYSCQGKFYDIGNVDNSINFQPLFNLESDLDFDFAKNWIEELCKLNGLAENFDDTHRKAIYKALTLMKHETPKNRRTISYFRHLVQDYDKAVATVLDEFSQEQRQAFDLNVDKSGLISKIFDASSDNLDTQSRFTVFEMSKLMELGDRIIIPAIRYLIHVLSKQFGDGYPTLIVFDESFLFFKHPLFREKIIEWIKTVRKFNVAIIFATQELEDLFKYSELKSALKTNCATKIFLPNRKALTEDIYDQYRSMDLNQKQISLIAHGVRGDYFYFSDLGTRKFSLNLDPDQATFSYVARTSVTDINQAIAIKNQYGLSQFGYYWLKYCNQNSNISQKWLEFDQQIKTKQMENQIDEE